MIKKKMSVLLAAVLVASGVGMAKPVFANAAENLPQIFYAAPSITMAEEGDDFSFALQSKYDGEVQYRIWTQNLETKEWSELTEGYSEKVNAKDPFIPKTVNNLKPGSYKAVIWVKAADRKGAFSNKNGEYDTFFVRNFKIQKDGYFDGRAKLDDLGIKDTYKVGENIEIKGDHLYKLHILDGQIEERSKAWTIDDKYETAKDTADDYTFKAPGVYLVDVWGITENPTEAVKKQGYAGWKLKVVKVEEEKQGEIALVTSVKPATVGSSVTVSCEYPGAAGYQIFDGDKQVSKVAKLGSATTMYPAAKENQEYTVKLVDAKDVVLTSAKVKLGETVYVNAPVQKEAKVEASFAPATVGSAVTVKAELEGAAKYQILDGDKQVTKIADLGAKTTMYPAAKDGQKVTVRLFDAKENLLQVVNDVTLTQVK